MFFQPLTGPRPNRLTIHLDLTVPWGARRREVAWWCRAHEHQSGDEQRSHEQADRADHERPWSGQAGAVDQHEDRAERDGEPSIRPRFRKLAPYFPASPCATGKTAIVPGDFSRMFASERVAEVRF